MIKVLLPSAMYQWTKGAREVEVSSTSIKDLIEDLEKKFPGIRPRFYADGKNLNRFVNIFVNQDEIRTLKEVDTELKDGDEVSVVPSQAGGC